MRHQVFGKKFNRDIKERKALFKSLINALIEHGKIKTTLPKAKAVRRIAEKLVTKAREKTDVSQRQVTSFIIHKKLSDKLINTIAPRFSDTAGGYTRIRRVGPRPSDFTEEVILEWTIAEIEKPVLKKVSKAVPPKLGK